MDHYALLADIVVVFHLFYVVFAVGGEAAILVGRFCRHVWIGNPVFRVAHMLSVVLVAVEASIGVMCPLTAWEYKLRRLAGQVYEGDITFIGRLVRTMIFYDFPQWVFTAMHISFGILVVLTFIFIPPRFRRKNR